MKAIARFILIVCLVVFAISCGQKENPKESATVSKISIKDQEDAKDTYSGESSTAMSAYSKSSNSEAAAFVSSAAKATPADTMHRFIRSAEVKFRTADVVRATIAIEDVVSTFGGFVTQSKLESKIDSRSESNISDDSLMETTKYTVQNIMTFRVPNAKLDSMLRALSPWVDFVDYRRVSAEDVKLRMIANDAYYSSASSKAKQLKKAKPKSGDSQIDVASAIDDASKDANHARFENARLQDLLDYSTVNLHIYQRQETRVQIFPRAIQINGDMPDFWERMGESLSVGWDFFINIIVVLSRIWAIIVIAVLVVLYVRYYNKKQKKQQR